MESSKTTTIGIGLIMLMFLVWFILNQPKQKPHPAATKADSSQTLASRHDSNAAVAPKLDSAKPAAETSHVFPSTPASLSSAASSTAASPQVLSVTKQIETPLVSAEISSQGGAISKWVLKNYLTWEVR